MNVFQILKTDAKYAWRHLRHHPAFALVVVLTLAVGIGANTSMFSVVNTVLINALPYPEPERVVTLHHTYEKYDLIASVSVPGFANYRAENDVFEELAAIDINRYDVAGDAGPERILGAAVTPGYFTVVGKGAALGRTFREEEGEVGNDRVTMLSHEFWERRFGGDPGVIGTTLRISGEPYEIVGVLPEDLQSDLELLVPLSFTAEQLDPRNWTSEYLQVMGRLGHGVSMEAAQANMDVLAAAVRDRARAAGFDMDEIGWNVGVFSARDELVGDVETALLVLLGAVGFVFLIACANVANLFLARSLGREREVAVRMSMGASRRRITGQLVTEGLGLALAGGVLGLGIAAVLNRVLVRLGPSDIPRLEHVAVDGGVLAFTLGLSVLAGILFASVPALQASATDLQTTLKEGGGRGSSGRGSLLKDGLVVAEIALALLLLVGSGLMLRSFDQIVDVAPGFDPGNTVSFRVAPIATRYPDSEDVRVFYSQLAEQIASLPGVDRVGAVNRLPLASGNNTASFGRDGGNPDESWLLNVRFVYGDYFEAARIPLLKGRFFDGRDTSDGDGVAIIDQEAARRIWPDQDPVGQRLARVGDTVRVVGVVGSVKHGGLDRETQAHVYRPAAQVTPRDMAFLVRTANDPVALAGTLRNTVRRLDPDQPVYQVRTMEEVVSASLAQPRFNAMLLVIFAGFALLLAAVGIQGVLSQLVGRRRREIGIRMALGADKRSVLGLVVGRGMALTASGLALGLLASLAGTRALSSLLYGVSPTDPAVLAGVSLFLLAVAGVAAYLPARRATRVDPVRAMSVE